MNMKLWDTGPKLAPYKEEGSTEGASWQDLFLCPGSKACLIGGQNGGFPDFGHHVKLEMGGLWLHPVKLLDGFWLGIRDREEDGGASGPVWLTEAGIFVNHPFHNEHRYTMRRLGLEIVRRQFCPDGEQGILVSFAIRNLLDRPRDLDVHFLVRTDLSPVWFSEGMEWREGFDQGRFHPERGVFTARDEHQPWHVAAGSALPASNCDIDRELFGPHWTAGKGVGGELTYAGEHLPAGGEIEMRFAVAGSLHSELDALASLEKLLGSAEELWAAKVLRYESLLSASELDIPDKHLQKTFHWVKFHQDWLLRDVPGVGRGLGAGQPEYPWWFGCDSSYAIPGLLATGGMQTALDTVRLLHRASEQANGNGRIIHEMSTNGLAAHPGNTQETAHFISCLWEVLKWTGDAALLDELYPSVQKGLDWLLGEMDPDGDLLPEGYGIIEIEGLNVELIDTAVYTWSALNAASEMAALLGDESGRSRWAELAVRVGEAVNRGMWLEEEGLYADAMAPVGKVRDRIDLYIERARQFGADNAVRDLLAMKADMEGLHPELEKPWLFKNWVINTPMEAGLAPRQQAIRALDRMASEEFTGRWGTYLSGMYRDQMMTISTGVQAVAEARYGRMDESLRYARMIASTFNRRLPGSMSEMSPDYGCFVQAWTNYGIVWPLAAYMFGIGPEAYRKHLTLQPRLPEEWKEAAISNVGFGLGEHAAELQQYEIRLTAAEDVYRWKLQGEGWTVRLRLPGEALGAAAVLLDGLRVRLEADGEGCYADVEGEGEHEVRVVKLAAAGS